MKKLFLYIFVFSLITLPGFAANYYVDTTCGDVSTYDPATPACTGGSDTVKNQIADLNAINFANGDYIYFRKGQTFNDANLTFAAVTSGSTKTVYLRAHGSGALPWIGGTIYGLVISGGSSGPAIAGLQDFSLDMKDLRFDSQENDGNYAKVQLDWMGDVVMDNVNGDGSVSFVSEYTTGVMIRWLSGDLTIKNSTWRYWGGGTTLWDDPPTLADYGALDNHCFFIKKIESPSTVTINDNVISQCYADGIQFELLTATMNIYNNTMEDHGENAIDFKGVDNSNTYNNTLGRNSSWVGSAGSSGFCTLACDPTGKTGPVVSLLALFAANDSFSSGSYGCENNSIYNNNIYANDQAAFQLALAYNATEEVKNNSIYHNYISTGRRFVQVASAVVGHLDNVYDNSIFNNKIILTYTEAQYIYEDTDYAGGNNYYNNSGWTNQSAGPFNWTDQPNAYIHLYSNSIFINNVFSGNESTDPILDVDQSKTPTFENNVWYNSASATITWTNYNGTERTGQQISLWRTDRGQSSGKYGYFENPDFEDALNHDLSLKGGAPGIDTGQTLTAAFEDAWNPGSPDPPITVATLTQGDWGAGWEIGAYVTTGCTQCGVSISMLVR
jgi:hypothetical protein